MCGDDVKVQLLQHLPQCGELAVDVKLQHDDEKRQHYIADFGPEHGVAGASDQGHEKVWGAEGEERHALCPFR